ncbi:Meiotic nuclear division protein 1 homolog [Mytilus edulis]|uniref:Meiotic nuclear division protein 1 homolog n=1 Tax=Mytilus edulis TaxID=6550 RepID=A0A8S3RDP5_MYTED|nr:Meiotic nuclear division protein 1 homolog [Mytilus edulis]
MMEFFFEKKDVFLLKELEKQCQKEKGITSMSVKEIVTSLVDDGMVDNDKIGTSVYFWAFPSKASQNDSRTELLTALAEKRTEKCHLMSEIEKYKECDPEVVEGVKKQAEISKDAANRWTDNIFSVKSWIKNKFSFEESVIDKQFGIPADFDYIE